MATKTVVCPECDAPLAPGRFACSACGALVASVASGARTTAEPVALSSPAESAVAWSSPAPPVARPETAPETAPDSSPEPVPGRALAEPAAQLDLDAAGWDVEPEPAMVAPAQPTVAPAPPALAVPAPAAQDASPAAAQAPVPPAHRRTRSASPATAASSAPVASPPAPPASPTPEPEPQPSWPMHPSWPLPAEAAPSAGPAASRPTGERVAISTSPAAPGALAEPGASTPAPDGFRFSDLHPTTDEDDPAQTNGAGPSPEPDDLVVPAGAYLPPSAVLPPAEALPLPGAAVAKPSRSGWQLPTISGGFGPIEVPVEASTRTIAAGGFVALAGFLLPWADVVIGSRSIGSFLDQWGLAAPGAPIVLLLVAAVTATAVMRDSLPQWVGLSTGSIAVAFLLIGLVWPYLFGPFGASIGVYAVTVGALVLVVGGLLDRVASRHAEAETGV